MDGLSIVCYSDRDECGYYRDGWCAMFDCPCEDIHIDMIREDGEE